MATLNPGGKFDARIWLGEDDGSLPVNKGMGGGNVRTLPCLSLG